MLILSALCFIVGSFFDCYTSSQPGMRELNPLWRTKDGRFNASRYRKASILLLGGLVALGLFGGSVWSWWASMSLMVTGGLRGLAALHNHYEKEKADAKKGVSQSNL